LMVPCIAGGPQQCCPQCGCTSLKKVCRQVPDVKIEKETNWTVVCEDICLPGPSRYCGTKCVPDPEARGGMRREIIWEPTCGRIITRKKLKKETVNVEVPIIKCVVDTVCEQCGCQCQCQ